MVFAANKNFSAITIKPAAPKLTVSPNIWSFSTSACRTTFFLVNLFTAYQRGGSVSSGVPWLPRRQWVAAPRLSQIYQSPP